MSPGDDKLKLKNLDSNVHPEVKFFRRFNRKKASIEYFGVTLLDKGYQRRLKSLKNEDCNYDF